MKQVQYILVTVVLIGTFWASVSQAASHSVSGVDLLQEVLDQLTNATSSTATSVVSGFSRDGVYGCAGASYGSVGMQGPSGTYVPVFDEAVFDQERLLTYKECVLDGIVNSMRETLISFIIKSIVRWTNQGFEGNPAYITNLPLYMLERIADPEAERIITGTETESLAEPFRRDVRVALAKYYATKTRSPEAALRCSLSDNELESIAKNDFLGAGGWKSFYTFTTNSSCNPLFAYYNASNRLNEAVAAEQNRERTQLDWGSGFRAVERDRNVDLGGGQSTSLRRIVTPGFLIAEQLKQTIGTGLRQSENADEIDEIISALMANIGTEMLTDMEGLSGLSASFGGQAPYIDRLAADSAARTRGNMTSAAASTINNTIRVEQEYATARKDSVTVATRSKRQLETWENTCWGGIIDKAKEDLSARVEERACTQRGSTSTPCGIAITVTESLATNSIGISVPSAGTINVYGRASRGDSSVSVTATGNGETVGPVLPTVLTTGNWSTTGPIDLSTIPDGTIVISAAETLGGGRGTAAPVIANVEKVTTVTGVELTPPAAHPAITITATANGLTESATIATTTVRSSAVVNTNVQPILDLLRENIVRSAKALEVLTQLRNTLASTTSASGQRFILERLDRLVAARVLHTEAQLRQARNQAAEIEAAMQQLLEETRQEWETGWCDPSNWEQLTS